MSTNIEIKRYYLYDFITNFAKSGNGHFTMVYFFFHGFPIMALLGAICVYAITCLAILKPVGMLIEKVGPQTTFRLHAISQILKYGAFVSIFLFPVYEIELFMLVNFFNGFNVMLSRIPLTVYFSEYGDNNMRGQQLGLANNIQVLASVIIPVLAGALIEETGLVVITTISTLISLAAIPVLRFDGRVAMKNPVRFTRPFTIMPKPFVYALFSEKIVYAYATDLLAIYIAIALKSFTVLGVFIGLRTAVSVLLNYVVGRGVDSKKIRPFFFGSVILSSLFWFVLPFAQDATAIFVLQFTLGLAGLVTSIPFESAYHNAAKTSGDPIHFSLWREVIIQLALVVGTGSIMLLLHLHIVEDWKTLLPIGVVSALAPLFIVSYIGKGKGV